jgi:hypothetical protein
VPLVKTPSWPLPPALALSPMNPLVLPLPPAPLLLLAVAPRPKSPPARPRAGLPDAPPLPPPPP